MKVLIYFSGNLSAPHGTPIRVQSILDGISQNGIAVYYAGKELPQGMAREKFLRLGAWPGRIFELLRFIRRHRIDVVYIQTSAGIWLAPFVKLLTRARSGVDFHSLLFEEERYYGRIGWLWYQVGKRLELIFCRWLDFATSVCHPLRHYYGRIVKDFMVFPPGVDVELFSPTVAPDEEILRWKGSQILIGYAGNTKEYQGVDLLFEVFLKIEKESPNLFKVLVIASSSSEELEHFVASHGLKGSVKILDRQPHEEIPRFLSAADILVIPRPSTVVTENSFPSKLGEYAALGKALVVSSVSDIPRYIQDRESGLVVKPGDAEGLRSALLELSNPLFRATLSSNARKTAEAYFDWRTQSKHLSEYLCSR